MANLRGFAGAFTGLMLVAAPMAAHAVDTAPDWVKKPTSEDLLAMWPKAAYEKGLEGKALVACIVTVQGTLRNCRVVSQTPEGAGFGAAAVALTSQFLMKPATHDGQPVLSEVKIPIDFSQPGGRKPERMIGNDPPSSRYISKMRWAEAPTVNDVLAAYPAKARAQSKSGSATLDCEFSKAGRLINCRIVRETPNSFRFGAAARELSSKFTAPTNPEALKRIGEAHTLLLVTFDASALTATAPVIGRPQWARTPTGEDMLAAVSAKASAANIPTARVVLDCVVGPGGGLKDCSVANEDPAGLDLGLATLGLAPRFALSVWTDEGLPTIGGRVRVPLRFNLAPEAPAKP